MKSRAFYFFAVLFLFCENSFAATCNEAIIYFVQFNLEEYVPSYSNDNIRSKAAEKWKLTEPSRIEELMRILRSSSPHQYRDGLTRAAVECGKRTFFINVGGEVETSRGRTYRINVQDFLRFHDSLRPTERMPLG